MTAVAAIPEPQALAPNAEEILSRGEQQLNKREQRVAKQVAALGRMASTLRERVERLKSVAPSPGEVGSSQGAQAFVHAVTALAVPGLDVEQQRRQGIEARWAALDARSRVVEQVEAVLAAYIKQLEALTAELTTRETELASVRESIDQARRQVAVAQTPPPKTPPPLPSAQPSAQPPQNWEEKRQSKRIPVQAAVTFESDANFYTGFSNDLSDGGLFIATVDVLPRGTVIDLKVHLPSGEVVSTQGTVRWFREYNQFSPDVHPGMGIQFVDLSSEQRDKVTRFLCQRDPMFYCE